VACRSAPRSQFAVFISWTAFPKQLSGFVPASKEEELIMTKRKEENEQFKPLSAVATSITIMGINEDFEFIVA
jgi:hypothetical protein